MIVNRHKVHFETNEGWHGLINECLDTLDSLDIKLSITQVKEKYNGLRIYWFDEGQLEKGPTSDTDRDMIESIIAYYEEIAQQTCEWCGIYTKARWMGRPLCPKCTSEWLRIWKGEK